MTRPCHLLDLQHEVLETRSNLHKPLRIPTPISIAFRFVSHYLLSLWYHFRLLSVTRSEQERPFLAPVFLDYRLSAGRKKRPFPAQFQRLSESVSLVPKWLTNFGKSNSKTRPGNGWQPSMRHFLSFRGNSFLVLLTSA